MIETVQATDYWTPKAADLQNVEHAARFYWESVDDPQRFWVQEAVALVGAESVLEVGCQCGPNLRALAQHWPSMRLDGVDVNRPAIEHGRRFAGDAGLSNITFHEGALPGALANWATGSVDVVLSVYCLAYINPHDIVDTVEALLRIARKGIILIEPLVTDKNPAEEVTAGDLGYVEWRHDYLAVLNILAGELPDGRKLHAAILPRQRVDRLNGVLIATHQRAA
ncbi:MAG TPA: class I SAM-dependent methyltransferase [Vicinamibacterales bacterium]|nr:class I SAM-dependent methyltransferase [Vicinamibacterales bacterium]